MEKITKILEQIINWGLISLAFLLPLFFLPLTTEFYEFNKNILLIAYCLLLIAVWTGKMVLEKKVSFRRTAFDLPILLLAASFVLSTLLTTNKVENLLAPGGTGTILALTLLYFLATNNLKLNARRYTLYALLASAALLGLIAVYQFLGVGAVLAPAAWMQSKFWTPAGSLLSLTAFLVIILTLMASQIWDELKNKKSFFSTSLLYCYIVILLIVIGGGTAVFQLFTSAKPLLLPYWAGWQIAVDTFKNSSLLGMGPANFLAAFTASKPLAFNLTSLWNVWFGVSSNWYFQLLTTVGILGLGAFFFLIWRVLTTGRQQPTLFLPLVATFLILAFLPANLLLLTTFYFLLAIAALGLPQKEYSETSRVLPWMILIPVVILVAVATYFTGRAYMAEFYFKQSLDSLGQNQGTQAYNLQVQAIALNPYQSNYRIAYSQTNFALANAIATKSDLADQDRQNIAILIQQAIREAKAATTINPQNALAWENLAFIYRRLINSVQGADQWAIAAYQQTLALDPLNPNLRLTLGGIYYGLQNWDEAIKFFEQAIALKPNFANGHYNLAAAHREKGNFEKAIGAMENTLALVPKDSEDWQKAQGELEALKKRLAEKPSVSPAGGSEALTPPEPLPTGIKPPLSLPTGVEPEISPLPEATTTP